MKSRVLLVLITVVAVTAMAFVMAGCSCSKDTGKAKQTENIPDVPTAKAEHKGNGSNVVEDDFESISPVEKTTDKNGNEVVKYTNADGNKVTRITKKNGEVTVIIKNKKGKVIKKSKFVDPTITSVNKSNKKDDNKDDNKDGKKDGDGKADAGVANDDGGWSDFY